MNKYAVWFQDGHIMMNLSAESNQEARKKFNKYVSIKRVKELESEGDELSSKQENSK
jgi:hypothetical protein